MPRSLACALVIALPCLLSNPHAAAQDIIVGQVLDQSGLGREISRDYFAGAKVYFDHTNAQGGVNGRRIVQKTRNDEGNPAKTAKLTTDLIEIDSVDVLFGYTGDANIQAAAATPAFIKSGIALVGAVSDVASSSRPDDHIYFTRATYAEEAKRIVGHFRSSGMTKFAIAFTPDAFGREFRTIMVDTLKKHGLAAVSETAHSSDSSDVRAVARKVLAKKPQVVVMLTDTLPAATFVKAFREFDQGAVLVGTSLINARALLELAGPTIAHGVVPYDYHFRLCPSRTSIQGISCPTRSSLSPTTSTHCARPRAAGRCRVRSCSPKMRFSRPWASSTAATP